MRILLINSGNDKGISGNANAESYPPLGIISLATCLVNEFENIEVFLRDGQVDTLQELKNEIILIRPDIVGISMYSTSICNTIELAKLAKVAGAITILGNDHAAFHYETILNKIAEVDYICIGDVGENTIVDFVYAIMNKIKIEQVPFLAYRSMNNTICLNKNRKSIRKSQLFNPKYVLDSIPIPNRNLLPQKYWNHYYESFVRQKHKSFNPIDYAGITTINRARGCARKNISCKYCGIADLSLRKSSAKIFWQDVEKSIEEVNASFFYEAFDSATSCPSLIKEWVQAKPNNLDVGFFMYSQANETNKYIVDIFKKLGVKSVNTGFDSGDNTALKILKSEKDSVEQNKLSAALWSEADIEIHTSFVLIGLGNEYKTRKSLDDTLKFAEWLVENTLTMSLDTATLYPDKNSRIGNWLWHPNAAQKESVIYGWDFIDFELLNKLHYKWKNEVYIDPLEISADFAQMCGTNIDVLLEYDKEIKKLTEKYNLNFGRSQAGPI
ncbi:hypothetical protein FACS1894162_2730 [Bacteroidia bacterium]|nr:hypothetical protein FACS1894162_2730 [Bacteroidia bacterium]